MLTKNHDQLTAEVQAHIAADAVVQGNYWNGSKGCFIGCLAHSSDATVLQERFGLPLPLVRICENTFEWLPADDAKAFFAAFPDAVGQDGKDLSRVHWQFLASELRALPNVSAEIQKVIDPVIDGMDLLVSGQEWSESAAYDSARAVESAAYDSARAADAYAAATAAYAYAAARAARADSAYNAAYAARAAIAAAHAARAASYEARGRQRDTILRLISEAV